MKIDVAGIKKKLIRLKEYDKTFQIFGSNIHKYEFNPTLSSEKINQFEMVNKVELPTEYKQFLLEIGNGGAGPAYGILKLEQSDPCDFDKPFALLSSPFPYVGDWNIDQKTYDKFEEEMELKPDMMGKEFPGCLRVCFLGCTHYLLLIVTGKDKATIWYEGTGSGQGISPIEFDNKRVTFFEYYNSWLNESLEELGLSSF